MIDHLIYENHLKENNNSSDYNYFSTLLTILNKYTLNQATDTSNSSGNKLASSVAAQRRRYVSQITGSRHVDTRTRSS